AVTIHAGYSPSLKHLLNETTLKTMKSSAFLINAARGPVGEEGALIKALEAGVIAGAAMDVFEFEPKIGEDSAKPDNVVLTPHIGTVPYNHLTLPTKTIVSTHLASPCLTKRHQL
ncbi:NAD(P)-dependent oxidoreductase, partial [Listeria monocytogenes]|uniref:NAD(P)-dependent oxidoreductase n=1 Tax=Listeria monocytogenes TaxID=1639 RepID=UPI0025B73C66